MRIAVVDFERCRPKDCGNFLCVRVCPVLKAGVECIGENKETGKPFISEELCTGCGICPKKCPFQAITIINLPESIGDPVHRFGLNGFRLHNLPTPKEGIVGLVGANGIGKSTALKILSGELKPNLGFLEGEVDWRRIIERFRGQEIQNYLEQLSAKNIKAVYKPQYVDSLPKHVKGKVRAILKKADEEGRMDSIVDQLDLGSALDKSMDELSGGELQRVAVAAALGRKSDVVLLDEPSSYLDVKERLKLARLVRAQEGKNVFVVEHDLVVLDYLSDWVHVFFGEHGVYGIVSNSLGVRAGINEYLSGFLTSENMRFRQSIKFEVRPPKDSTHRVVRFEYPSMSKTYDGFSVDVGAGVIRAPEILGILGPNATGKTTFVKMLAGAVKPDGGEVDLGLSVSYKPQYIQPQDMPVAALRIKEDLKTLFGINYLLERNLTELSGGELQKVAVAECLSKQADVYLLDEPSAYLDIEERLKLAKHLKRFAYENATSIMVVDHDILLIDYLSDALLVFEGEAGVSGRAQAPLPPREGMNLFLKQMDVTFRRDPDTGRPRANKPGSVKDREQRAAGEYYYG
ncbi:Trehalose/maltose import ATP-binding protein MalK [uncultured archaeon]|nr:Trehalose/maltose import ATP-binding protein MalK [uncultured archaeon]